MSGLRRLLPSLVVAGLGLHGAWSPAEAFEAEFDIGAGVRAMPAWEGANSYTAGAYPVFKLHRLDIPGWFSIGGREGGWSVSPSLNVIRARKQADDSVLRGLGNVETAVELGARLSYRWENLRAFALMRQGFGGHDGQVGEVGLDVIWRPGPRLELEFGPRLAFASNDYMQTYFGVSAAQALISGHAAHTADAGLKSAGAEASARFEMTDRWSLVGKLQYDRLLGDAAASPLVKAGSADQFTVGIGTSYRLHWQRGD